ncbi:NAD(P)/FAD-dependent oxidoreductase [Halopenitus sp. H-Gu1]|uniref:NAD(P)/FAD-dependent oxidoreductase n=1 Tax=Halopenitus sp. H-Gu1 TaxID=3242697 RepID=UPI00359E17B9
MDSNEGVVVIGGGVAGLTTAATLAEAGVDVTVVEREETVGGRVKSRDVDGFTIDRGFQVLFEAYPALRAELDLDALDLRPFAPGAVICRPGSRSTLADPFRDPVAAIGSILDPTIPFRDKFRTLLLRRELTRRSESDSFTGPDETIRTFLRERGFSARYIDRFVEPFYGGITLDRSLSSSSHVFEYTFRAMSRGRIAVPADGMGSIPRQLADRAEAGGGEIRTGTAVERIDLVGSDVDGGDVTDRHDQPETSEGVRITCADGTSLSASAAVVATSPPEARRLTGIEAIPTEGVGCVTQWYTLPAERSFEVGTRILLNAGSERPNAVIPIGEVAPSYAPEDRTLFAATFVDDEALEREADALAQETREALASWYPERAVNGLRPIAIDRTPFAQFAQPPGFRKELPNPDDPAGPIVLAGDYTRWSSLQGAVESGRRANTIVREHL